MPRKKTETEVPDLDFLLSEPDEVEASKAEEVEEKKEEETKKEEPALTPEQLELEALRAELAELKASKAEAPQRPVPESELTPEQREVRRLQDELARVRGQKIDTDFTEIMEEGEVLTIHILEDGFTRLGRVWYRGEEIVFGPQAYENTKDRNGVSWLNMDDDAQIDKWGHVKFRKGPWPGKRQYEEESLQNVSNRSQAPVYQTTSY